MTPRERLLLTEELVRIQREFPQVNLKRVALDEAIALGQARADEIEAMLVADTAKTVPSGELEP